nr:MAG TPA: antimicrobial protein [Caudoviricetes sp.]DAZ75117.1 MAG TPA: antimicrobial protein [Caudoviricetes sp.]
MRARRYRVTENGMAVMARMATPSPTYAPLWWRGGRPHCNCGTCETKRLPPTLSSRW